MPKSLLPPLALAAVLFVGWTVPVEGAAKDANPVDSASMLEALAKLLQTREQAVTTAHARTLQMIEAAASSPSAAWAAYQEAVRAVQFDGQVKEGTKFRDWKKKEDDHLDDPDFRASLPVHLSYLALTLRRADGAETKDLLPAVMRHAALVEANREGWGSEPQMMQRAIPAGVFAKHFGVDTWASQAEDWEMIPGNVDGIYEKTILPELRRMRNPEVIDYWDARIRREAEKVALLKLAFQTDRFEAVTKPSLLWRRAQELRHLDMPNRTVNEMFALLKAYPGHPDFPKWVAELQAILKPQPAGVPPPDPPPGFLHPAPSVPSPAASSPVPVPVATPEPTPAPSAGDEPRMVPLPTPEPKP